MLPPLPNGLLAAEDDALVNDVTAVEVVEAVVVFAAAVVLAVVLRRLLVRTLDRQDADRHVGRLTGRFLGLIIVAVGVVYALDRIGVRIGPLLGALGVGGIALAFAAQDVLQNLVAGVLLQVRRPFRIGDQIGSGDFEGVVDDINLRTVELTTYDGLEQARQVLLQGCRAAEGVAVQPPPEVWAEEFAESSINLDVRYWHAADIGSRWRVRSAVAVALKAALDEAGIRIPFPQRTLWFGPGGTRLVVADEDREADGRG